MEYQITRKRIKNFILRIYPDLKIAVSAPISASDRDIEKFISSKREWIEKTLEKIKSRQENLKAKKEKGINILGREVELRIISSDLKRIRLTENSLYFYTNESSKSFIEKILLDWKIEKLKEILEKYLEKYTTLLETKINYYKIKKLSSAWGIYHKRENYISFNFDLIEKEEPLIEYVVLHELCHIFHMDHQKGFWSLVEKYMPDYKERRKKLKY
nr:SprT family zinc-dependent metalloprotease [uncultured Fusobacterium sp.]